jgi:hypothetical protein
MIKMDETYAKEQAELKLTVPQVNIKRYYRDLSHRNLF